jgi:adenylate kinase family enzyme
MDSSRAKKTTAVRPSRLQNVVRHVGGPLNIFFLGDLGAGKATQSAILAKRFNLVVIDMGVEQELQRKQDPKIDAIFKRSVDAGKMNPTAIYRMLVKNAILRVPKTQGIIFAGHPKMPAEVRYVAKLMKQIGRSRIISLYVTIPWTETIRRNLKRKGYFGDKKRADDSLAALKIRRNFAQANLIKSQPIYRSLYPFKKISGLGTKQAVTARVKKAVDSLLAQI